MLLLLCPCYRGEVSNQQRRELQYGGGGSNYGGGSNNDGGGDAYGGNYYGGGDAYGGGCNNYGGNNYDCGDDYDGGGNPYLLNPEPPAPPPSTPPLTPVQKMQLKQCVTTADGQVRSVSIPVGKTLNDPRIQKRFERMFKSPMVLPGTVSTSEVEEECVACSGRC